MVMIGDTGAFSGPISPRATELERGIKLVELADEIHAGADLRHGLSAQASDGPVAGVSRRFLSPLMMGVA
jgi:hypothetical protein